MNHESQPSDDTVEATKLTKDIINRQRERTALRDALTSPGPGNVHIYGPRGSGKTSVTHTVLDDLPNEIQTVYLTGMEHDTQYKVLERLAAELTGEELGSGYHTSDLQHQIEDHLYDTTAVVVLDEVDFLLENDGNDLLYYLSRIDADAQLTTVCISANHDDLAEVIDDRTYSSFHPRQITFDPYSVDQARRILAEHDIGSLDPLSVSPQAFGYIASQTQNLRRGLHWLQYAADTVEDTLTQDEVKEIEHPARQLYWDVLLKDFSIHHHYLLEAIDQLSAETVDSIYTGEIYDRYEELCEISGKDSLSQRRLSDYLRHLELLHIIQADYHRGGKEGKTREITLTTETQDS
jgi:orc1/cdc6 family replication initiation protein